MKQHVARTALIFLIRLLPALASLVALVLLSRATSEAFYGAYQRFWVQWQVLNTIACLGLPALIYTYPLAHVTGLIRELQPRYGRALLYWLTGISAGFAALQSFHHGPLFDELFIALFLFLTAIVTLLEAYLLLGRRYALVAWSSAGYAVLFVAMHVLLIRGRVDVERLFEVLVLGNAVRVALLGFSARRLYLSLLPDAFPLTLTHVRHLWVHLGLYDLIQVLFRWIDKLVLGLLLSAPLFAVYFNGTVDVPFLPLLLGAAGNALLMQLSQQELPDAGRIGLIKESGSVLSRIVFPVFFFLAFFRTELFAVAFHHRYDASAPLFLISLLVLPLRGYNFTSLLQHKRQGRIINIGAALDLVVAIVLMYPLYLMWGLRGIALAFVLSTYLQVAFYLHHTARIMRVRWHQLLPLGSWCQQLLIFGLLFAACHYVAAAQFNSFVALLLGGMVLAISMIVALWPVLLPKRTSTNGPQV